MADNVIANPGAGGATFATDDDGTAHHPYVKVEFGADNTQTPVSSANPLPVTQTGVATSAKQDTGNTSLSSIDGKITAVNTGAVVVSSSALPSGASTAARQDTGNTSLSSIDGKITAVNTGAVVIASGTTTVTQATGTNLHTVVDSGTITSLSQFAGTAIDVNSGNKGNGTLRVVLATDQPALTNKLLVTPDANSAVNMAQVAGTNTVTAGVAGTQAVGGNVATNVAIGTNPINLGAQAVSAENTAVTATRMAQLVTDLVGKLIVLPYANPENFVSGVISSAMTGTTSTSLIAAPASGLRNYITQITVSNSHATVGTDIIIQDGNGGTTLYVIPAAAVYGGATLTFPVPLRQPTTATAIYCANVTTGSNTKVSASGYKGA